MSDWLDAIPNLGVPRVPSVPPQETAGFAGTPAGRVSVQGVPECHSADMRTRGTSSGTPAPEERPLKWREEHREHREHWDDQRMSDNESEWRVAFDCLDSAAPLYGLDSRRWQQLLGDAQWVLDSFASNALRDGWTVGELFGLWPGKDRWGGIADRLQGSRSLKMTADRAHWRRQFTGASDQFVRGTYPELHPLWER